MILLHWFILKLQKKAAVVVYIGGFCLLSFYNLKSMYYNYGGYSLDIELLLMQVIMKITYTAWSVYDFYEFGVNKAQHYEFNPKHRPEKIIRRLPTLLEFLGYNLNFVGLLGPSTDLSDWLDYSDQVVVFIKF